MNKILSIRILEPALPRKPIHQRSINRNEFGPSAAIRRIFQPHQQEGDPEPGFYGTIVAFGRGLKDAIEKAVRADMVLFAANAALDAALTDRGDKTRTLGRLVSGLRGACSALFVDLPVQ